MVFGITFSLLAVICLASAITMIVIQSSQQPSPTNDTSFLWITNFGPTYLIWLFFIFLSTSIGLFISSHVIWLLIKVANDMEEIKQKL